MYYTHETPMRLSGTRNDRNTETSKGMNEIHEITLAPLAFTIDQVKMPQNDRESQEISHLVISVFFEEAAETKKQKGALNFGDIIM
jgi:hypothetical protein